MVGPILRLKDLMVHTGLSRSTIYDRMDKKSPRYAADFPKSFSLSGGAIGWSKNDVVAWLEACANNPKSRALTKKTKSTSAPSGLPALAPSPAGKWPKSPRQVQESPLSFRPVQDPPQTPLKRSSRPRNLAEAIVEGGEINARLLHYLQLKAWTPAMGAMLIAGLAPSPDCTVMSDGGIGLDGKPLHTSNARFHEARRILKEWQEWQEDSGDRSLEAEPTRFLGWCIKEDITTEWMRLLLELIGCTDEDAVDLTASRFALLTGG